MFVVPEPPISQFVDILGLCPITLNDVVVVTLMSFMSKFNACLSVNFRASTPVPLVAKVHLFPFSSLSSERFELRNFVAVLFPEI
jgi:hypothetical protein